MPQSSHGLFLCVSVVTENMNNTNKINILTNQSWSTHPKTLALRSREESGVQGYRKLCLKKK